MFRRIGNYLYLIYSQFTAAKVDSKSIDTKPAFGSNLRLAEIDDLNRLGLVGSAGFYHSPVSLFERPERDTYPDDTWSSYKESFLPYIIQPDKVLLVVQAKYKPDENEKLYPALRDIYKGLEHLDDNKLLPVGLICLTLSKDSKRIGDFQPPGDISKVPNVTDHLSRDQSKEGMEKFAETVDAAIERHFKGNLSVDMLAVHPAYWRNGYGTSLVRWTTELAELEGGPLGVDSAPMGIHIFERAGFLRKEVVEIKGYDQHPKSISIWIGVRPEGIEEGQGLQQPL